MLRIAAVAQAAVSSDTAQSLQLSIAQLPLPVSVPVLRPLLHVQSSMDGGILRSLVVPAAARQYTPSSSVAAS